MTSKARLVTSVEVLSIDLIDTVNMKVGLSLRITQKLKDYRIMFEDLLDSGEQETNEKEVDHEIAMMVWMPMANIIHENAEIGNIEIDDRESLQVLAHSKPLPSDASPSREILLYKGHENFLQKSIRLRLQYRCDFYLINFPFDNQQCDFIMKLKRKSSRVALNESDTAVTYKGPKLLNSFEVGKLFTRVNFTETESSFIFTIHFNQLFLNHFISIHFKTVLLWLIAYSTLFINIENFNNRFMGSITALLVLTALLGSINEDLPITSYFKYIDMWFTWYIANIFCIIVFHIFLDKTREGKTKNKVVSVDSRLSRSEQIINTIAKYGFFGLTLIFIIIYGFISCFAM